MTDVGELVECLASCRGVTIGIDNQFASVAVERLERYDVAIQLKYPFMSIY